MVRISKLILVCAEFPGAASRGSLAASRFTIGVEDLDMWLIFGESVLELIGPDSSCTTTTASERFSGVALFT